MSVTIDLGLLAMFVEVAEQTSFSRAAKRLGTTTATVSRGIGKLEAATGARLLHRTTRRVSLTTAGSTLFDRAAPHVRAVRAVADDLPEDREEPGGTLKITAPHDLGATLLGGIIAGFVRRYPKVRVDADFSSRPVDIVAEGVDVAIRGDYPVRAAGSLRRTRLVRRGELRFYASPGYLSRRGIPRELGAPDHDWLIAGPLRRLLGLPRSFEAQVVANDFLFLRGVAHAGAGVAMLPGFIAQPHVTAGELVRVLPDTKLAVGGLVLLYSATRPLARKVAAFRDFMLETVKTDWLE